MEELKWQTRSVKNTDYSYKQLNTKVYDKTAVKIMHDKTKRSNYIVSLYYIVKKALFRALVKNWNFGIFYKNQYIVVKEKLNHNPLGVGWVAFGSPKGTRTPVFAVRGRRLNRLTMRPYSLLNYNIILRVK